MDCGDVFTFCIDVAMCDLVHNVRIVLFHLNYIIQVHLSLVLRKPTFCIMRKQRHSSASR